MDEPYGQLDIELRFKLEDELKLEQKQLEKLSTQHSRNDLEVILEALDNEIDCLEKEKDNFGLDKDTLDDIGKLDEIKIQINRRSSRVEQLSIRLSVIEDSIHVIEGEISHIDLESLRNIYEDTKAISHHVLCEFSDLVEYHNRIAVNRREYLAAQIPQLRQEIDSQKQALSVLLREESELRKIIARSDSYSEISDIISRLGEKNRRRGQVENQLQLITETMERIEQLENRIREIADNRKAMRIPEQLSDRVRQFNRTFSYVSRELFGEEYALSFDDPKKGSEPYTFKILSMDNFSTGKKQGEVISFDIAYIMYSDECRRPCMHFLLNDKKELMHNNPIRKIADFVADKEIQLVFPILKDKVPEELIDEDFVILTLSQTEKLFRIEEIDGADQRTEH